VPEPRVVLVQTVEEDIQKLGEWPLTDRSMAVLMERRHPRFRDSLITSLYDRFKDLTPEAAEQEFFQEMVWLLELGRNMRLTLHNQVLPSLVFNST